MKGVIKGMQKEVGWKAGFIEEEEEVELWEDNKTYLLFYGCVNYSSCRIKLNYADGRKLLDLNQLSPISLLPGVGLTWSCYHGKTRIR